MAVKVVDQCKDHAGRMCSDFCSQIQLSSGMLKLSHARPARPSPMPTTNSSSAVGAQVSIVNTGQAKRTAG